MSYRPWGHKELDMTEQLSTVQYVDSAIPFLDIYPKN